MRSEQQAIDVKGLTGERSVAMQDCLQEISILATLTTLPGAVGRGHRLGLEHTGQGTACKNGHIRASTWCYRVFTGNDGSYRQARDEGDNSRGPQTAARLST
jgi:hypothetical protein